MTTNGTSFAPTFNQDRPLVGLMDGNMEVEQQFIDESIQQQAIPKDPSAVQVLAELYNDSDINQNLVHNLENANPTFIQQLADIGSLLGNQVQPPNVSRKRPSDSQAQQNPAVYQHRQSQLDRCLDATQNDNEVYQWLISSLQGRCYILAFKRDREYKLAGDHAFERYKLLRAIVWRELERTGAPMSVERMEAIAENLARIFTIYPAHFWFQRGSKDNTGNYNGPRGALYDVQRRIIDWLKTIQVLPDNKRIRLAGCSRNTSDLLSRVKRQTRVTEDFYGDWLLCIDQRKDEFQKMMLDKIYSEYLVLTSPNGYLLLLKDFSKIFGLYDSSLKDNWPSVALEFLKAIPKLDIKATNGFNELMALASPASPLIQRQNAAFFLIPHAVTIGRYSCVVGKKNAPIEKQRQGWSASALEVSMSFIHHIKTSLHSVADYNALVEAGEKTLCALYAKRNLSVGPHLVVCGPITNIVCTYVISGTNRWRFDGEGSIIEAVDVCFKSTVALRKGFCKAATLVWEFLESAAYQMPVKTKAAVTKVKTAMELVRREKLEQVTQQLDETHMAPAS